MLRLLQNVMYKVYPLVFAILNPPEGVSGSVLWWISELEQSYRITFSPL